MAIDPQKPETASNMATAGLYKNFISWVGMGVAAIALLNILFLMLMDLSGHHSNPYLGILAYMVLPGFLVGGLLLIPLGMWRERRRRRTANPEHVAAFPRIDLNDSRQRRAFAWSFLFLFLFLGLSAIGTYRSYEYSETTEFCGQLCHEVMHPEFTAYQASPHARVACVDCHVGPGAGWYVKSKLSGARQIFAAALETYPRPIPTPVENLRPAQETCEQCHWPRKFWGAQLKVFQHFASDEQNTPRQVQMLLKIGGGDPDIYGESAGGGIHWHMNIANEVTYVTTDAKRQVIPWVQVKDRQGKTTTYKLKGTEVTDEQIKTSHKRVMDCVDCHNRPSHIYVPPDRAVNQSIAAGLIDRTLPYIKQQATTALSADYESTDAALKGIETTLQTFYETQSPDVAKQRPAALKAAITETQRLFKTYRFPSMKVDWRTHADNVGHMYYAGCFRCHDGQHVDDSGKAITNDCNACHQTLTQTVEGKVVQGGDFKHPVDMDLTGVMCMECHTGGGQ